MPFQVTPERKKSTRHPEAAAMGHCHMPCLPVMRPEPADAIPSFFRPSTVPQPAPAPIRCRYSITELMISRRVSLCMEMPGRVYQDPPVLLRITESSMCRSPLWSLLTKKIAAPWALTVLD